jgi:integrase
MINRSKLDQKSTGWVFPSERGTQMSPRNRLRHFYSVLERLDIPKLRFHDLRHTAATILLQKDVHPKKVQELLGHSSITLTLDTYSHIIPGIDSQTSREMDVFRDI